jgi:thiamine-phosphate pyrophosphorylase
MPVRHPRLKTLPSVWLMTDERMGDRLIPAVRNLPKGSGIIFRHYSLPNAERRALFQTVKSIAKARRHTLLLGGEHKRTLGWRADGSHGRHRGAVTTPVHNLHEMRRAEASGAMLLFLSPIFSTASHVGAKPLGRIRFARLAHQARLPVIALGGMSAKRAKTLRHAGCYGWAAIDAFLKETPSD